MYEPFIDFVNNYNGPPLDIIAAGGGDSLAFLGTVPGSSRCLHAVTLLHSEQAVKDILMYPDIQKFVSPEIAKSLSEETNLNPFLDHITVGVTAALTTNRWRRGENHAYFCFDMGKIWHASFPKLPEDEYGKLGPVSIQAIRSWEDMTLAGIILKKLYPELKWEMPNGVVVRAV